MKGLKEPSIENPYVINEFGYVSRESAGFYEKFMNKYCNVKPEGYYLGPPSTKEMKELKGKRKSLKTGGKRKKVKSKATIEDDDDDSRDSTGKKPDDSNFKVVLCSGGDEKPQVPRIKILLPVRRPQNPPDDPKKPPDGLAAKGGGSKADAAALQKRQFAPAPLSFEELLKLAEKKQHEPVLIRDSEFNFRRPMTRKEKVKYQQKIERMKRRKEELNKEKNLNNPSAK